MRLTNGTACVITHRMLHVIATEEHILELLRLPEDNRGLGLTGACQRLLAKIRDPNKWGWDGTYADLSAQNMIDNAWILSRIDQLRRTNMLHMLTEEGDCVAWCEACRRRSHTECQL